MNEEIPKKRLRLEDSGVCIFCNKPENETEKLSSPKDKDYWKTLLSAAELRGHDVILEHKVDTAIPKIKYHQTCRKQFTHKKSLAQLPKTDADEHEPFAESPDDVDKRHSSRNDPTDSVTSQRQKTYNKICIFCGKASKYRRGSRSREPLRQCAELRADAKVR